MRKNLFVDDLDRLIPSKAVELLEVLKLFLDCKQCVFVLAIDYEVVIRGSIEKYGFASYMSDKIEDKERNREYEKGKSFFDKIIQVLFKVPVAVYDIKNYLKMVLTRSISRSMIVIYKITSSFVQPQLVQTKDH